MAPPPRPLSPDAPSLSSVNFHVDPLQHASDPSVVPGQIDIAVLATEPSSWSAMVPSPPAASSSAASSSPASRQRPPVPRFSFENSAKVPPPPANGNSFPGRNDNAILSTREPSSASVSRKLPPVPKFTSDSISMGPPPSKPSVVSQGFRGPPPVPKFRISSTEQKGTPPPAPHIPSESPASQPLSDQSSSTEKRMEASNLGCAEKNGGEQARDLNLESGTLASAAGVGSNDGAVVRDVAAAVEERILPFAEEGSNSELRSAAAGSGVIPSQPPYLKPSWSAVPGQPYSLEILKEGNILGVEDVSKKGAYMFGRSDRCDFVLEHPTVSRYHAVLQYNSRGESFLYDLGSTHGTFVNKLQVKEKEYIPLHVGDIVRFGYSSRLHAFQGPLNLMPKEGLSKKERLAQRLIEASQDRAMREQSLIRGKKDSLAADGISWGMQEDAEEEQEENVEEITWQTFKGELTEKQQKTLEKIHKHNEKLSNLKKENDAIQAKEISQGGLTQGQQTQVARNEQRMEQLVEEVESLEETLNESIQESINGRTGRRRRGKRNPFDEDDEDDDLSDDEFYDRASKLQPQKRKEIVQTVETAESLLDKRAPLASEIASVREAIKAEEQNVSSSQKIGEAEMTVESEDPLDQFMTNLSSTILKDRASHLQKELDTLVKESERVERLLKLADPTGEGFKKWELKKSVEGKQHTEVITSNVERRSFPRKEDTQKLAASIVDVENKSNDSSLQEDSLDVVANTVDGNGVAINNIKLEEDSVVLPGLDPPLRLGAPILETSEEAKVEFSDKVNQEALNFVTYKDRKKAKGGLDEVTVAEFAQKHDAPQPSDNKEEVITVDEHAADSVALLLRHKRGLAAEDADVSQIRAHSIPIAIEEESAPSKKSSKKRKKQGAARSSHLTDLDSSEDWVPPAGQTGDGRTALNDKYGY